MCEPEPLDARPQGAFDVAGRVVVLTGGAGLLGTEYAWALSLAGAHVVVADVDAAAAARVAAGVPGADALAVPTDVADPSSVVELARIVREAFGRVDALVNNAALDPKFDAASAAAHTDDFERFPLAAWNAALAVNLTGAFLCAQAFAPALLAARGTIVNVGSTYGLVGPDQRLYDDGSGAPRVKPPTYSVTKAGLVGLTRYLAAYYGERGLRVNALVPGGAYADHDDGFVRRYSSRTPLGRMARRDEYCGALQFLLSDAASYMTGACLVVDGGWTAW